MDESVIDIWSMIIGLLGGLAIFLFGLNQLTDMLKSTAGVQMSDLLARTTSNRFKGVLAGGVTTAIIQSSSVTTVLTVGFVSAGLMSLQQSIGIIMGAEIGTTVTAQIIAFKITRYALLAVIVGFVLQFFFEDDRMKRYGTMVLGLGLVFYGMSMMGDATRPLRSYQPFVELLAQMDNRFLAVLLSAGFTGLVQSSSATTGVIIVLGGQGLISLEQGIALVLGANIGTCVTALLASIGKQRLGLRAASIHVTFNVLGVVMWFGFIDELAQLSRWLSPASTELSGVDRLAAEIPRQIANAHTIFQRSQYVRLHLVHGCVRVVRQPALAREAAYGSGGDRAAFSQFGSDLHANSGARCGADGNRKNGRARAHHRPHSSSGDPRGLKTRSGAHSRSRQRRRRLARRDRSISWSGFSGRAIARRY